MQVNYKTQLEARPSRAVEEREAQLRPSRTVEEREPQPGSNRSAVKREPQPGCSNEVKTEVKGTVNVVSEEKGNENKTCKFKMVETAFKSRLQTYTVIDICKGDLKTVLKLMLVTFKNL